MSKERVAEFVARNVEYAKTYVKPTPLSKLAAISKESGSIAILTCSDPRIIPEQFFNFSRHEALVIRNAGACSIDCMRSLQVLDAIGSVSAVVVVHHNDCGDLTFDDEEFIRRNMRERNAEEEEKVGRTDFGGYKHLGLDESLRYDVEVIKNAPFLRKDLYVADYALDDSTGLERLVVEAGGPVASISSLQG